MKRTQFLLILVVLGVQTAGAQSASTCLPIDDNARRMVSSLRDLVTSTDPSRVQVRTHLGLQAMDSMQVNLVLDNRTCDRVAGGLNSMLQTRGLVRQLYVVKVGTDYAAKDPGNPAGEWWPTVTFNGQYKFKAVVLSM